MKMLYHKDPNVRYEALLALQKMMVTNWYRICILISILLLHKFLILNRQFLTGNLETSKKKQSSK